MNDEKITLERLGDVAEMSPYHLQRKFKQALGLSPAQYIRAQKSERMKTELKRGETVSRASFGAGYSSSSRVYEDAATHLGMTPAKYKRGGEGTQIEYVIVPTSLGQLLVGATDRGVCAVTLGDDARVLEDALDEEYPAAIRSRATDPSSPISAWVKAVVATVEGATVSSEIPLDVQASAFQWRVWRELQKIPFGETRSYAEIANAIGSPTAVRAVATAIANNRVAVIIPCHRVIRQSGDLGGYRWGIERKQRLIAKEQAARGQRTS
jgi:AraC family transcriptional regulator of adaptative response/methylated-DNA-[protein]-cysteine methyltransferase